MRGRGNKFHSDTDNREFRFSTPGNGLTLAYDQYCKNQPLPQTGLQISWLWGCNVLPCLVLELSYISNYKKRFAQCSIMYKVMFLDCVPIDRIIKSEWAVKSMLPRTKKESLSEIAVILTAEFYISTSKHSQPFSSNNNG